jgi:ABC-type multidrug transport system fused ATPase/permease subunit
MDFKENFNKGNNYILSPNGVISRTRYFLYAILLDVLYRVFNAIGGVLGKEVSWFFYIIGLITIPIIVLKFFNYKKRAFSFLNNNTYSYLYAVIYIILGILTQGYLYLLKLANQKAIYELTHDSVFQHYANINVPSFIGAEWCQIVFYILCGLGFIMFLALIFIPSRNTETTKKIQDVTETIDTNKSINSEKDSDNTEVVKNKNYKWLIFIPTIILYLVLVHISYSEIHWRAYNWMNYVMNEQEVNYANEMNKFDYEQKLNEYNMKEKAWRDCLEKNHSIYGRFYTCRELELSFNTSPKPEQPFYYDYNNKDIYQNRILRKQDFDLFGCKQNHFNLLSYKCGDLTFNDTNRIYVDFHPYAWLISALILLLPISFYICAFILYFITFIVKKVKSINFKSIKIKLSANNKSNLTQKLEELNKLKEQGLITEEDYNNKKAKLLEDF